jgi:hypothetical protein
MMMRMRAKRTNEAKTAGLEKETMKPLTTETKKACR